MLSHEYAVFQVEKAPGQVAALRYLLHGAECDFVEVVYQLAFR